MALLKDSLITGDLRVTGTIFGNLNGNATSANKLATTRTINGTNFDGSANITTANWGTARTISIGSTAGTTGTSVNGSGNVSLIIPSTMTGFSSITSTTFVGALTGHASSDLALSGGTMTGDITFTATTFGTNPTDSKGLVWSGGTDGAKIFYRQTANNAGSLVLQVTDDGEEYINFRHTGGGQVFLKPNTRELFPDTNNTGSLGTSSYKWANVYATTFHGTLDGNASTASNCFNNSGRRNNNLFNLIHNISSGARKQRY